MDAQLKCWHSQSLVTGWGGWPTTSICNSPASMFTPPSFDQCVRVCLWFYHFTLNLLRSQGRPHHDWPFQMDNTREEEYASKQQMISSQTLWPYVFFRGTHHHHWPAGHEAEECLEPSLDLWLVAAGSHLDISLPLFNNIIHKMDSTIIVDDPRKSRHINPVSSDCRLPVLKNPHFLKSNISISPISAYQYHQYHRHVLSTLNLPPFIKPFL